MYHQFSFPPLRTEKFRSIFSVRLVVCFPHDLPVWTFFLAEYKIDLQVFIAQRILVLCQFYNSKPFNLIIYHKHQSILFLLFCPFNAKFWNIPSQKFFLERFLWFHPGEDYRTNVLAPKVIGDPEYRAWALKKMSRRNQSFLTTYFGSDWNSPCTAVIVNVTIKPREWRHA